MIFSFFCSPFSSPSPLDMFFFFFFFLSLQKYGRKRWTCCYNFLVCTFFQHLTFLSAKHTNGFIRCLSFISSSLLQPYSSLEGTYEIACPFLRTTLFLFLLIILFLSVPFLFSTTFYRETSREGTDFEFCKFQPLQKL
jgi:hypothetical protein